MSFWDAPSGKDVKVVEEGEPDVQVEGFAVDVLRSGKDAKAAPPVKSNRPSAKTRPVTAARSGIPIRRRR